MVDDAPAPSHRLSAILHADAVGFAAAMGADEAATHAKLRYCLDLARQAVSAHGGRMVGTAGDAFLAEFPSVLKALAAAVEFQESVAAHGETPPAAGPLAFRVGINLGEVIVDGDDIFGDGVNVAARIQALAPPGGIAVSEAVHDIARSRAGLSFADLGRHQVKNVAQPIRVYAVRSKGRAPAPARASRRIVVLAVLVLAIAGALAAAWLAPGRLSPPGWLAEFAPGGTDPAAVAQSSEPPTIAVLPFSDAGAAEGEGWFSAGVTEDIIGQLGRFSGLTVLSWNAVAPYRDRVVPLDELHRDLGAGYVVGGSIRRASGMVRVAVQLSDAADGTLLWSERYDEPAQDLIMLQDRISRAIVEALSIKLTRIERDRSFDKPTESLGAYDLVLQGRDFMRRTERDDNWQARALFHRAIDLDPDYAGAWIGLASTHLADMYWGWTERPWKSVEQARDHAAKAISLAPDNAGAHVLMADVLRILQEFERARAEIDRAIELNPNSASGHTIRGKLLILSGKHAQAAEALERSLRLDPNASNPVFAYLAQAYYLSGRFQEVVDLIETSGRSFAEDAAPHALLAAAHARLGHDAEARRAADKVRSIFPFFDARLFARNMVAPHDVPDLVEGLALAGLE